MLVNVGSFYLEADEVVSITYYKPHPQGDPNCCIIRIWGNNGKELMQYETTSDKVHEQMDNFATAINYKKRRRS